MNATTKKASKQCGLFLLCLFDEHENEACKKDVCEMELQKNIWRCGC